MNSGIKISLFLVIVFVSWFVLLEFVGCYNSIVPNTSIDAITRYSLL